MMEPPYTRLLPLLDALSEALGPYLDVPYAIFGNCTGSFISFELSHTLTRSSGRSPVHLFTSNCRAPQLPETDAPIHALPDAALLDELQRLGGTPVEIIQHPELMGLVLPTLRADFELAETYEYSPKEPLDCPITTFGGLQDCIVTQDLLRPWGEQTRGSFKLQMLPGSHYMLESAQEFLVSAISSDLAPHLAR
jgi:medium-chain acyl-[acyl-carrier-protein] hydrolase